MKKCAKCNVEKELSEFGHDALRPDGLFPYCRMCRSKNPIRFERILSNRINGKKHCPDCGKNLGPDGFYKNSSSRDGLSSQCKNCMKRRQSEWEVKNKPSRKDKARDTHLRRLYGITKDDYDAMLKKQNGKCFICGRTPPSGRKKYLAVDHNHSNGKVRGLLCEWCNKGLGGFGDSPDLLIKAAEYLLDNK